MTEVRVAALHSQKFLVVMMRNLRNLNLHLLDRRAVMMMKKEEKIRNHVDVLFLLLLKALPLVRLLNLLVLHLDPDLLVVVNTDLVVDVDIVLHLDLVHLEDVDLRKRRL